MKPRKKKKKRRGMPKDPPVSQLHTDTPIKFDCKLCGLPLGDQPGAIPVIGEDDNSKERRYVMNATLHLLQGHADMMSKIDQACAELSVSGVLANVATDHEAFLCRRRIYCAHIAQMVTPKITDEELESIFQVAVRDQTDPFLMLKDLRDRLTGKDVLEQQQEAAPKEKGIRMVIERGVSQ
jgi:hypothetical protein